ncbi:MAG TPA: hypothetical protein PKC45_02990 [Gemmatales bacterium]|nr:hypothetical protein [Gemmatales bacterium]
MSTTIKTETFPAIDFKAFVRRDPENVLKGQFPAKVTAEGLQLSPPGQPPITVPPGADVKYLGENRISVAIPGSGRVVQLGVIRRFGYQNLLALDIVAFMGGDIGKLKHSDYSVPWALRLMALLPFAILAFMFWYGSTYKPEMVKKWGWETPAVAAGLCSLLALLCLFIMFMESTKAAVRAAACVCVTGLGFLLAGWFMEAITLPRWFDEKVDEQTGVLPIRPEFNWRQFDHEDFGFSIGLPAEPAGSSYKLSFPEGTEVEIKKHSFTSNENKTEYVYEYCDIPEALQGTLLSETAWFEANFRRDFPTATEVVVADVDTFKYKNRNGTHMLAKEVKGTLPDGRAVLRHSYAPDSRLYVMTVIHRPEDINLFRVRAFFDSFKLEGYVSQVPLMGTGAQRGGGGGAVGGGGQRGPRGGGGRRGGNTDTQPTAPETPPNGFEAPPPTPPGKGG